jgi:sugar phosphate isomerase/epimerase
MSLGPDDLVSSHFTLTGSQPMTPPRFAFAERAAAAAEAGFAGIGMLGDDYFAEREQGLTDSTAAAILADHGLELAEVEFLFDWSAGDDELARIENARHLEERVWAVADAFGPRVVSVGELLPAEMLPPFAALADRFGALCDRAAEHGLLVALEFMPFCGIPDIAAGRALVEAVGRANAGLNVDSYHYFRGNPDPEVLRAVGDRAFMIQLDDADAEVVGELFEDTMLRRRYPGEGSFELVDFLRILNDAGAPGPKSVEILSSDNQALAVEDAARRAHDTTRAVVDAARTT